MSTSTGFRSILSLVAAVGGLLLCVLLVSDSQAYDPTARISIAGQVGMGFPAMGEVNDEIDAVNAYLTSLRWKPLDQIETNFNFLYDVRARITGPWSISLGGGRMSAESFLDFDQIIEVAPVADFYQARLLYELPFRPRENIRLSLGGGIMYAPAYTTEITHEQRTVEAGTSRIEVLSLEGKGTGGTGLFEVEVILSEAITLCGDIGYRQFAAGYDSYTFSISNLQRPELDEDADGIQNKHDLADDSILRVAFADEEEWHLNEGDIRRGHPNHSIETDFSGIQANVGLRFYLF